MENLNKFQLDNDGNFDRRFVDNSIKTENGISVYFRNLDSVLIEKITQADFVYGAVAWLTNYAILDALAKTRGVSIIVQKEDFLRPDITAKKNWAQALREKYGALPEGPERWAFDNILGAVSVASNPTLEPVRCVGNHNRDKEPAFPRMHNKFLVFVSFGIEADGDDEKLVTYPYAVWTGSFNLTANSANSLENALYIENEQIARAYFEEYGQIAAMSEPLDWESEWCSPQWRIGT